MVKVHQKKYKEKAKMIAKNNITVGIASPVPESNKYKSVECPAAFF